MQGSWGLAQEDPLKHRINSSHRKPADSQARVSAFYNGFDGYLNGKQGMFPFSE